MMNHGVLHLVSTIIRNVMSSAAEDELASLYLNKKGNVIIWNML